MAIIPPSRTRRFRIVKFIYQADNGDTFIRTQRIFKDTNGNDFIRLPNCFQVSQTSAKEKIWATPDNLRRTVIRYENPDNNQNTNRITLYVPRRLSNEIIQCLNEIKTLAKNTFSTLKLQFCIDYFGENRNTINLPNRLDEL